ncbi:uncharacterized protein Dmoj_GI26732 [Drosophila mojavensis]|uniref:Uncharacterized protein n=1 Tax=Drosophila mojavensis TaxID=7230 RepID=A0A0Q9XFA4_DROMO|nr:uncharacterized protein Dmoj_GI26732 [Drosophila mojavensis]
MPRYSSLVNTHLANEIEMRSQRQQRRQAEEDAEFRASYLRRHPPVYGPITFREHSRNIVSARLTRSYPASTRNTSENLRRIAARRRYEALRNDAARRNDAPPNDAATHSSSSEVALNIGNAAASQSRLPIFQQRAPLPPTTGTLRTHNTNPDNPPAEQSGSSPSN